VLGGSKGGALEPVDDRAQEFPDTYVPPVDAEDNEGFTGDQDGDNDDNDEDYVDDEETLRTLPSTLLFMRVVEWRAPRA